MVGDAIDDQRGPIHFADNAAEVGEQVGADFRCDQGCTLFCGENQMDNDVAAGLRHVSFALSGLWSYAKLTQGEGAKTAPSPWAAFCCPFGAVGVSRQTKVGRLSQAKFGALE